MMLDVETLGVELGAIVRDCVAAANAPLLARIDALEKQLGDTQQMLVDWESAPTFEQEDIDKAVATAVSKIPVSEMVNVAVANIPPAKAGKDADPVETRAMVEEIFSTFPKPENGKDVDEEVVKEMVERSVQTAVSSLQIPVPKDGKTPTRDEILDIVKEVVAQLPPAKDGEPADPVQTAALVERLVEERLKKMEDAINKLPGHLNNEVAVRVKAAVEAIPPAKDGEDADPAVTKQLVEQTVGDVLGKLELDVLADSFKKFPEDLKAEVASAVKKEVEALPVAKNGENGKDADPAKTAALVDKLVGERMDSLFGKVCEFSADIIGSEVSMAVKTAVASIPPAKDGESVTVEQMRELVDTSVKSFLPEIVKDAAALVPPGKSVDPHDVDVMVKSAVSNAITSKEFENQLKTEAAIAAKLVFELNPPEDGKDADPEVLKAEVKKEVESTVPWLRALVKETVEAIPVKAGEPGKDADPEVVRGMVSDVVAQNLDTIVELVCDKVPVPENGKDADMDALRKEIRDEVKETVGLESKSMWDDLQTQFKMLPVPKNGDPGKDADADEVAKRLLPEVMKAFNAIEFKVPKAEDFLLLFEAEQGKWALNFERRAMDILQKAIDKMPIPKDGKDALRLSALKGSYDIETAMFTMSFEDAERNEQSVQIRIPRQYDKGVFKEGSNYIQGDGVTWGGSYFYAQKDAPQGKPGESPDWRMGSKRGRDGKDLRPEDPKQTPIVSIGKGEKK